MSSVPGNRPRLVSALLLLTSVWLTLLVGQAWAVPRIGTSAGVLVSFVLATLLVFAARGWPRLNRSRAIEIGLGTCAGLLSFPAWIALIAGVGAAVGFEMPSRPSRPQPVLAAAILLLAPVFEEILYREQLLCALRRHLGSTAAVLLSSAAFAVAHVEPWAVLGAFLVGLGLGTVMCVSNSVAPCIGLHMGLNARAWLTP